MITDPIADLLTRLRNASAVRRETLLIPHSKLKASILSILAQEGIVSAVGEKVIRGKKMLEVILHPSHRQRMIPEFIRVSKPGRRMYVKAKDIPNPLRGYGLVVLSTPQGLMTGKEARRKGLGGEILFTER